MTEKRKTSYSLAPIKRAFADPHGLNRTFSAAKGAEELGMEEQDVVEVVAGLTQRDFVKSMTAYHDHRLPQDVYTPSVDGQRLYVKFTLDQRGNLLLISFKGNDDG